MKNLKSMFIEKAFSTLFMLALTLSIACNSNGQKATADASKTNIHEAVFMGNKDAVKAHIEAKTDLNVKDQYGSTPLSIAITFDKPEVAKLLIEGGADINATNGDGSTPLHTAAFFCRKETAQLLLDKGANIEVRNNFGSTALESISGPFANVKSIYDQLSKDLGPFGLKLDYEHIKTTRPEIAAMIKSAK